MSFRQKSPAETKRLERVKARLMGAVRNELQRGDVSASELLALMAHTTGACIAFQDQRTVTPEMALELVSRNIEAGNIEALGQVRSAGGSPQ